MRGGFASDGAAVHGAETESRDADEQCGWQMGRMRSRERLEFFGGGLLFCARFTKGAGGSNRSDSHFLGRLAGGGLDERRCPGLEPGIQARHSRCLSRGKEKIRTGTGRLEKAERASESRRQGVHQIQTVAGVAADRVV